MRLTRRWLAAEGDGEIAPEVELRAAARLERFGPGLRERRHQDRHRNRRVAEHRNGLRVFGDATPGLRLFKAARRSRGGFRQVEADLYAVLVAAQARLHH